jgi:hypothetical protein
MSDRDANSENDVDIDLDKSPSGRSFEVALQQQLEFILKSDMFRRSPKLSELLSYLVKMTIRGEGATLKSYTVAVDGLGRHPSFDANADSYPRVQVLRLRNLLATFYARNEPLDGVCLYLLQGSYRVRLAKFEIAYSNVQFRNLPRYVANSGNGAPERKSTKVEPEAIIPEYIVSHVDPAPVKPDAEDSSKTSRFRLSNGWRIPVSKQLFWVFVGVFGTMIASFIVDGNLTRIFTGNDENAASQINHRVPSIDVAPVEASPNAAAQDVLVEIHREFELSLSRSWVVHPLERADNDKSAQQPTEPDYRLVISAGRQTGTDLKIYVNLVAEPDDKLIWSRALVIRDGQSFSAQLENAVAEIASPGGIIARRELQFAHSKPRDGYTCLLSATGIDPAADAATLEKIDACIHQPVSDARLDAVRLAIKSYFMSSGLLKPTGGFDPSETEVLARQSVKADPYEAYGYFALAFLNYKNQSCQAGKTYAQKMVDLKPIDTALVSRLDTVSKICS